MPYSSCAPITRGKVGAERKTWNTSNMLYHVKNEHKDSYKAQKPDHEKKQKEREIDNPTPGGQNTRFQQASIKSLYAGKKKWTVDDSMIFSRLGHWGGQTLLNTLHK